MSGNSNFFLDSFNANQDKRVDIVEFTELSVDQYPEWAEEAIKLSTFWIAKLSCGHVAGPYVKANTDNSFPKRMVCSLCRRRKK